MVELFMIVELLSLLLNRKENELVIEVPSVHGKSESSMGNLALSLMVSFVLEIEDISNCFG